jgi:hypothetical protein
MSGYSVHNYWKTRSPDHQPHLSAGPFQYSPLTSTVEAQLAALNKKLDLGKKATDAPEQPEAADDDDQPEQKIDKQQLRAIQSINRMNNWAMAAVDDPKLVDHLHQGLVLKHSVHKHEFRDRDKALEKSAIPFMPKKYPRLTSFKTSAQRANESEQYHKQLFLDKGPFDEKLRSGIERQREKNKELGHDLAFGVRTENERINKAVEFNALRDTTLPDNAKLDMVHFPRWKEDLKDKWVSQVSAP